MSEWQFPLRRGNSPDPAKGACLLDAVSWIEYGRLGDHPLCVDDELADYGRSLNDWLPFGARQGLREYIPLLAGTAGDLHLSFARGEFIVTRAMEIAVAAGLKLRHHRVRFHPIAAYEYALMMIGNYAERERLIFQPAIALLGEAIALGARTAPPVPDAEIEAAVLRFRLAQAA
jgi:hypothetical protein